MMRSDYEFKIALLEKQLKSTDIQDENKKLSDALENQVHRNEELQKLILQLEEENTRMRRDLDEGLDVSLKLLQENEKIKNEAENLLEDVKKLTQTNQAISELRGIVPLIQMIIK